MKKLKLLLLSVISIFAISCDKDEPKELSIIGKWEYEKIGFNGEIDKTEKTEIEDYPNKPDCSKDYLLFFKNHSTIEGNFEENCYQYTRTYQWEQGNNKVSLKYDDHTIYDIELINNNLIKLSRIYGSSTKASGTFFILRRAKTVL